MNAWFWIWRSYDELRRPITASCNESDALVAAIHAGDLQMVSTLLAAHPILATDALGGRHGGRTALHVVTDWPGYFPNGPQLVHVLVAAGADPNVRFANKDHSETPLHWAASSDDADVAEALIDAGADIGAPDGSIGAPLDNAIGYSCWNVARLLVARGAKVDKLWHAAALGMLARVEELIAATPEQISQAFWHACSGGQRRAAELLVAHGADLNWVPSYSQHTPLDAVRDLGTQRENLIGWMRERGARSTSS